MSEESWEAMCEENKRTIKNVKSAIKGERKRVVNIIKELGNQWRIAQEDADGDDFEYYDFNDTALYDELLRLVKTSKSNKEKQNE